MNVLLTILLSVLVLANLVMLFLVIAFKNQKQVKDNKASRVGFAVMGGIYACNVIAILGGMICFA